MNVAKPVDFNKLSPRAQAFFTERAAKQKAKKSGKGSKGGGGS